jgi:hypothetical protein
MIGGESTIELHREEMALDRGGLELPGVTCYGQGPDEASGTLSASHQVIVARQRRLQYPQWRG